MSDKLTFVRRFPDNCCAEVSRKGESQPCDKTAVAVAIGDGESEWHWPVCVNHARGRAVMSLAELISGLANSHPTGV